MTVDVSEALKSPGVVFKASFVENLGEIEYLGFTYRFCSPVALKADYVYTGSHIVFEGCFKTSLTALCSRCLKEVCYPVSVDFSDEFSKTDPECYEITGETVSLNRMVEDNILLNLPGKFLCKEDCKGLCPNCGADLNEAPCNCAAGANVKDNPFTALRRLLDENKEV